MSDILKRSECSLPTRVLAPICLAAIVGVGRADDVTAAEQRSGADPAPISAVATLQSTDGMTESDLTLDGARGLEKWLVETTRRKMFDAYAQSGGDPGRFAPRFISDSQIVDVGGKRLAVVRLTVQADKARNVRTTRMVRVLGFTKDGAVTVGCIRHSDHEIPMWSGVCGDKIQEQFGVTLGQH